MSAQEVVAVAQEGDKAVAVLEEAKVVQEAVVLIR